MDDLKELILDKAKERFDRFGYKKTTMDEISRDCKISKRTIYEQFNDKEDLFTCLFVRENHEAREAIFAHIGEIADPLEKLIQLIKTAIHYFSEDSFLTRLLKSDDALFSIFLSTKCQQIVETEVISMIADIVNEGKQQGILRDVDERVVAYAGLKLFQAFSYKRTMEFCKAKEEQGYYTAVLVDFIVNAIVKK